MILGVAILLGIINCGSNIEEISPGQSIYLEKVYDAYYFIVPAFQNDVMAFDISIAKGYNPNKFDFKIALKGFAYKPSDAEVIDYSRYTSLINYRFYEDANYDTYSYPFSTTSGVTYLAFYCYTESQFSVTIRIRSESRQRDVILRRVGLLEEVKYDFAQGRYFFGITGLENDKVAFEIKAFKPYYFTNDFVVYYALFSDDYPSDEELKKGELYTPLSDHDYYSYTDYDLYSYPFETPEGVNYLGFYLYTEIQSPITIYIKSEKVEEGAAALAVIIIVIIVVIAAIGAGATLLLRKFGCWVRVHSSQI